MYIRIYFRFLPDSPSPTHCNTLQHTTTHCNTLQHTGIDISNIVETSGARPRRAAAAAFLDTQKQHRATKSEEPKDDSSDDEESLLSVTPAQGPLSRNKATPVVLEGRYNLADSDSE